MGESEKPKEPENIPELELEHFVKNKPYFPGNYTHRGKFELRSGEISDVFYDANEFLTDFFSESIFSQIPNSSHYIGIATAGAIIAFAVARERKQYTYSVFPKFSFIKREKQDGKLVYKLKGEKPAGEYILIDDVATTGYSLQEAVAVIGTEPRETIVLVDRRPENIDPRVISLFLPRPPK